MTVAARGREFSPAAGQIEVSPFAEGDRAGWDRFLAGADDATLFHELAWGDAAAAAYGHRPVRLLARRGGEIVGVLPMTEVAGPLFGRALVSTAYSVGGGALARDGAVHAALVDSAVAEAELRKASRVELRGGAAPAGWAAREGLHEGYARSLADSDDAELLAVPRKRRAEIRKGLQAESEGRMTVRHDAGTDAFWRLYAVSLRNLGTPVFPLRCAPALAAAFGDRCVCPLVEVEGAPAFSVMSFVHRDCVMPYYAGVTPLARAAKAADFGYFAIMREARARGLRRFDFGRSKVGSPHADYKKSWGFVSTPIVYHLHMAAGRPAPDLSPTNPKFELMSRLWRRLPQPVANALGPVVARELA